MSFVHQHSWTLHSTTSAAFAALTDASQLSKWFAEHVDVGFAAHAFSIIDSRLLVTGNR